jgi:hypothetical protein
MFPDVPEITCQSDFPEIQTSARMAIIIPTARWTPMARAVFGMMAGVANEEVAVLIADNSESLEKRDFLRRIRGLNSNVLAVSHKKNIGGKGNLLYLFDWCRNIEFVSQMADDDWISPTYHLDAYQTLLSNPDVTCAESGTTFVDIGDGKLVNVSQPSMRGGSPLERMQKWNCITARATMYNTSRRSALEAALEFIRETPLPGMTMAEDLWELNRLALGDFVSSPGPGCLIHYPENGSTQGDSTARFYNLLCKDVGLAYPFVFFMGLSTAVQCAIFLMGNRSPIEDAQQRTLCGQFVFSHIFSSSFLPRVAPEASQTVALSLFADYPSVAAGFSKYCNPPFALAPHFDGEFLDWFISLLKVFESPPTGELPALSDQFRNFAERALRPAI